MNAQISLLYIIPAVFILLLVIPIVFELRISFNPFFNRGVIAIFVMKKKVLYYIVSFHNNFIELKNENETKFQKIEFEDENFEVFKMFIEEVESKIKLSKIYVFYNIGTGDAFLSAMVCGLLNQILGQIFVVIKSKKPTASLQIFDTVSFNKEICEIACRTKFSLAIFDLAYSWVYSFVVKKIKI